MYPVTHNEFRYTDLSSIELCDQGLANLYEEDEGRVWLEAPSEAHAALVDGELQS
jgi:hypothetical protein